MTAASGRVCVVGSFMMDIVARTSRRPAPGETVIGEAVDFYLGGKGFNQALAAARQGATTSMVGRLGVDDFGDRFLAALAAERIGADGVGRDGLVGTGTGLPVVDAAGEDAPDVVPRANAACTPSDVEASDDLRRAAVVLAQLELPLATVRRALELARESGATTILNPAPFHPEIGTLRGLVDVVTPNETEAAMIAGRDVAGDAAGVAADVAAALDAPTVVLTLGADGALVWDRGRVTLVPAHAVDVVDTVGAGDATCGTLAAALAAGASLLDAVRRGTAAGSLAVTVAGAEPSMPTAAAVDALLSAVPATAEDPS